MHLMAHFKHAEQVVSARCRKPKPVPHEDGEHILEIVELTDDQAPIAFIERANNPYHERIRK